MNGNSTNYHKEHYPENMDWLDLLLTQKEFLSLFGVIRTPIFVVSHVSSLSAEPLLHFVGDDGGGARGAAVAGQNGVAFGTDVAVVAVHNSLEHSDALGAEAFGLGGDVDAVVEVDLPLEVDIVVDYHNGEVALLGRQAAFGEEGLLAEVEVFHNDSVVDVAHLVHVVESNLDVCNKHN